MIGIALWFVLVFTIWGAYDSWALGLFVATVLTSVAWDFEIRRLVCRFWQRLGRW